MRTPLFLLILLLSAVLAGCASTITSEVTVFHEWSGTDQPTYAFDPDPLQASDLEYRSYENLLRSALLKAGLHEATAYVSPEFKVKFSARISAHDVRVVETVMVDSWYGTPWYGPGYVYPYWHGWTNYGHPIYGPTWHSMPVPRDVERHYIVFQREIKINITHAKSGRAVYEVTVRSEGNESNLAKLMPYLIESAFNDFPGKSGEPRIVTLPVKK